VGGGGGGMTLAPSSTAKISRPRWYFALPQWYNSKNPLQLKKYRQK